MDDFVAPERIWLQTEESEDFCGITWSSDRVNDSDIEYVKAEALSRIRAERDEMRKALEWYADPLMEHIGERARRALNKQKEVRNEKELR